MPVTRSILLASVASLCLSHAAYACTEGMSIKTVTPKQNEDEYTTVTLNDDSVWRIPNTEEKKVAAWKPEASIMACDDELINMDLSQAAEAARTL